MPCEIPLVPLLQVRNLSIELATAPGRWRSIVSEVSFHINRCSITGLLGESGVGKTTLALALLGLLPKERYRLRGAIEFPTSGRAAIIFQDPLLALNPVLTVRRQVEEVVRAHGQHNSAAALLELAGLPPSRRILSAYPHQLSGGERQRVTIAQALASQPDLIIADEPFTALDVVSIAELVSLFRNLREKTGTSLLLITHSLGVLAALADSVLVMQHGRIVEQVPHRGSISNAHEKPLPGRNREAANGPAPERFLRVEGLSKTYSRPPTTALHNVSLDVEQGCILGIVGRSGSGKSTLARCLAGQETPTSGAVRLDGHSVQLIVQQPAASLNPRFTASEIVAEPLTIRRRTDAPERRKAALRWMETVGLSPASAATPALQFSGGERQRLAIARALVIEPQILILDESFSGLDRVLQTQLAHLLLDLQQRLGLTMILISHDLALIARLADEVVVLHAGRIVEHGPATQILTNPVHPATCELLAASIGLAERE